MANQALLCVGFLIILNISAVLCRIDFYQYHYSRYHRSSSTTATPLSSEIREVSTADNVFSKADINESSTQDVGETKLQHGDYPSDSTNELQMMMIIRVVLIVGAVVFFIGLLCCLKFCCPGCCSKTQPGIILRLNNPEQRPPALPAFPAPQPAVLQHYPPTHDVTQFPPPYQTLPDQKPYQQPSMQQQFQYSPLLQEGQYSPHHQQYPPAEMDHNPSTAPPPPYDPNSKY